LLVDFGLHGAHGSGAGLMAARASYLGGFAGTSTFLAERAFGIPTYGTMVHSFIQSSDDETEAFAAFARARLDNLVLLIDPTFWTPEGLKETGVFASGGIEEETLAAFATEEACRPVPAPARGDAHRASGFP
jgi:hypothetical protein